MKDRSKGLSLLIGIAVGFTLIALAGRQASYGWLLFLGVPFLTGFLAVVIYTWGERRRLGQCLWVSIWPFLGVAVLLLAWRIEGIICIATAAPIAVPVGLLGGYVGWLLQRHVAGIAVGACLLLIVPPGIVFGHHGPEPRTFAVSTSMIVEAPPETVWRYITEFPAIGTPAGLIFRAGVAYPVRTEIDGDGPGVARRCVLSTGVLNETVSAWEPPHLLRFRVDSMPPAMHELSPWRDIDPPHLHGFYVSRQGEFRLTPLPGGRTRIEGTSWYSHGLEPALYWRLWSDYVVHGVHRRVLEHIKALAEEDNTRRAGILQTSRTIRCAIRP